MSTPSIDELKNVSGIGPAAIEKFRDAGYETLADVADATIDDITDVPGIGKATAQAILEYVADEMNAVADEQEAEEPAEPETEGDDTVTDEANDIDDESDEPDVSEPDAEDGAQVELTDDEPNEVEADTTPDVDSAEMQASSDGTPSVRTTVAHLEQELSAEHRKILALFHDPKGWAQTHEHEFPSSSFLVLAQILEDAYPEFQGKQQTYDDLWADLYRAGLVTTESLHIMTSYGGALTSRTSPLGEQLLDVDDSGD